MALREWQRPLSSNGREIKWDKSYLGCFHDDDVNCKHEVPSFFAIRGPGWKFQAPGPAFQVWAKMDGDGFKDHLGACSEVSIAFPGTKGAKDFIENDLRPATQAFTDTSYRQLYRNIDAIISDVRGLHCYTEASPNYRRIVAAGTSLGAGLAQLAAFANNPDGSDRIQKVFAFNPSPDTGITIVERADPGRLRKNSENLEIDRVREKGEDLSFWEKAAKKLHLTWTPQSFDPPDNKPCKPLVRTVWLAEQSEESDELSLHRAIN